MINNIETIINNNKDKIFAIDASTGKMFKYYEVYNFAMNYLLEFSNSFDIKKNSRVILYLDNSIEFVAVYLWSFFSGVQVMPLSKKISKATLHELYLAYDISYVISNENIDDINCINISLVNDCVKEYPLSDMPKIDYDKIALLMYSSGTTGEPKCIAHSLKTFVKNAQKFIELHNIKPEDRFFQLLEMSYMAGFYNMMLLPFLASSSVIIKDAFKAQDILRFWTDIIKFEANVLWLVPTVIKLINKLDRSKKAPEYCETKVKHIFSCTAPLAVKDKIVFKEKYRKKVFNTYGLSETLIISSETDVCYKEDINHVGRTINEVTIDNHEIVINDGNIFLGYLEKSKKETFLSSKDFCTGDLGVLINEGLYITGRKKEIIIKGGININPKYMEDKYLELEYVSDIAIVGIEDQIYGERPVGAVVVIQNPNTDAIVQLVEFSKKKFAQDAQIEDFIILDKLPLNQNNKIDKQQIKKIIMNGKSL